MYQDTGVWYREGFRKYNVGDYYVKHHDMNEEKAWGVHPKGLQSVCKKR